MRWMERAQAPLALVAIACGVLLGAAFPGARAWEGWLTPAIAALLTATFLGVPLIELRRGLRDPRFLGTLLGMNFLIVPLVVFGVTRLLVGDDALVFGVLLVLLTPCVDYVIVFAGLGGGDAARLIAATPLLLLAQLLLLPGYLTLFLGREAAGLIDPGPLAWAFVWVILMPLLLALLVQWGSRRLRLARSFAAAGSVAMVPLLLLVLGLVFATQTHRIIGEWPAVLGLVPLYMGFFLVMVLLAVPVSRIVGLSAAAARSVALSGATRNSLVVLPLALAAPPALGLAATAVVTQTLVELICLVLSTRSLPRLFPEANPPRGGGARPATNAG